MSEGSVRTPVHEVEIEKNNKNFTKNSIDIGFGKLLVNIRLI